ncbi:MAG: glycosyltransferase family 2 protein [Prevotella sp.]|nr:glycosyltransferase family 2 protein [Prevotella sp.]
MSLWSAIFAIDVLLWFIMAASVFYVFLFSLASLLPRRRVSQPSPINSQRFLVLFPAYHEDAVIVNSVGTFLKQDYPTELYHITVISDHMSEETNKRLSALPITLLQPTFEKSSKAKALQYAIQQTLDFRHQIYDYVIILDADNIVEADFLSKLSQVANPREAIQCHRTAKNADNDIAALDGISEEINNSIFRRGHNRIGMSSALIGSGMCFDYEWFKSNVSHLDSAVEDRELEALLLRQRIFIRYAEDILVMDEKVSSSDNFQRQRLRWMTGQVQTLFRMLPFLPKALITFNLDYIDKTIQQALIPRSILLALTPVLTILAFVGGQFSVLSSQFSVIKWLCLLIALVLAIYVAIPAPLRTKALFCKGLALPRLVGRMLYNILHIRTQNKEFIHTSHHHN